MICQDCEGKRIIYGFGGLKHECKNCSATGKQKNVDNARAKIDKVAVKVDKRFKNYRDNKKEA